MSVVGKAIVTLFLLVADRSGCVQVSGEVFFFIKNYIFCKKNCVKLGNSGIFVAPFNRLTVCLVNFFIIFIADEWEMDLLFHDQLVDNFQQIGSRIE